MAEPELSQKQRKQQETYLHSSGEPSGEHSSGEPSGEHPQPETVLIGDDAQKVIDEMKASQQSGNNLPPVPCGILDWTEEEQKGLLYSGDQNDYTARLQHKLGFIWQDWGVLRNNERLIKIINTQSDPKSDDFFLKQTLVLWVDRLGKILGNTPIVEELTFHLRKSTNACANLK